MIQIMPSYPAPLEALITSLRRLPGVGRRTAERYAFEILGWSQQNLDQLSNQLSHLLERIPSCKQCGCLIDHTDCRFCAPSRDQHLLCVVATAREAFAIEETGRYKGLYHVLGSLISPLEGKTAEALNLPILKERLSAVEEMIIALDSTVEGDATALFLKQELSSFPFSIYRLAFGLPVGSSLEYIDESTLARALQGRQLI